MRKTQDSGGFDTKQGGSGELDATDLETDTTASTLDGRERTRERFTVDQAT